MRLLMLSAQFIKSSLLRGVARDRNEGNEGVINYPAATLVHKSQNQWARQTPVCEHTVIAWETRIWWGLIKRQKRANYYSNRLV